MRSDSTVVDPFDEEIDAAACDWFIRRRLPDWSADDEVALSAWLAADSRHRAAYAEAQRLWSDLAEVALPATTAVGLAPPRPRVSERKLPERRAGAVAGPLPGRRRLIWPAAVAACLLASAGGWYAWEQTPRFEMTATTAAGETRQLQLPDGSRIDLNFASEIRVRYYPRRRELVMPAGEAFFNVEPDRTRPFTIDSGLSRTTVLGTRFNLRADPARTIVKVLDGRVEVQSDRGGEASRHAPLVLGPLQAAAVDASGAVELAAVQARDTVGDWRSGRLVFRRTPLLDVAGELSRYLGQAVNVDADPAVRALMVSGFADTRAPARFLDALPDLLPVRVLRDADGSYAIRGR